MENSIKKYLNVYTEASPNPASLKFVVNYMLTPENISFDFPNYESSEKSPLVQELFKQFPFIERVFIMNNFITITKKDGYDWMEIAREIKLYIQQYLQTEKPIFSIELLQTNQLQNNENDSDVVKKIKNILEEYVRPAVESDGGAIYFQSFDESTGKVTLSLKGSCSGCPSSTITLKAGIENLLKRMIPQVQEVVAENL